MDPGSACRAGPIGSCTASPIAMPLQVGSNPLAERPVRAPVVSLPSGSVATHASPHGGGYRGIVATGRASGALVVPSVYLDAFRS